MSDQLKDMVDIPKDFVREGTQFLNRCQKPDKREFYRISWAVGTGFVIMGVIGYVVKLSKDSIKDIPKYQKLMRSASTHSRQ